MQCDANQKGRHHLDQKELFNLGSASGTNLKVVSKIFNFGPSDKKYTIYQPQFYCYGLICCNFRLDTFYKLIINTYVQILQYNVIISFLFITHHTKKKLVHLKTSVMEQIYLLIELYQYWISECWGDIGGKLLRFCKWSNQRHLPPPLHICNCVLMKLSRCFNLQLGNIHRLWEYVLKKFSCNTQNLKL